ncbi:MAG: DUF2161 family putative PD-(D/E)XK-type phosphodiesterase, partial [Pseudomonadota bacterium]
KAALVAAGAGVVWARAIMADNHYGWFERVARGVYGLSPKGKAAEVEYRAQIAQLCKAAS